MKTEPQQICTEIYCPVGNESSALSPIVGSTNLTVFPLLKNEQVQKDINNYLEDTTLEDMIDQILKK